MIPILLENKVVAGSVAAALASGLAGVAAKYLHMDDALATQLATAIVVYVVTFGAGWLAKHTNRPELEAEVDAAMGVSVVADDETEDDVPEVPPTEVPVTLALQPPAQETEENIPDLAQPAE